VDPHSRTGRTVRIARAIAQRFAKYDLLSYASTVAFQVLYALVPLVLAGLALLGFLGLEEAWTDSLADDVEEQLDEELFAVVDDTVRSILGERRSAWLTFGMAFAIWQVSSAIRATSSPLNLIYHEGEGRPMSRRLLVTLAVGAVVTPLLVLAVLSIALGGRLGGLLDLGPFAQVAAFVARWALTAGALLVVVWLVLRYAPSQRRPWKWNSIGAFLVVGGWLLASGGFWLYLEFVASYESLYGGLASVVVLLTYLYLLAVVFFVGVQIDDVIRDEAEGKLDVELPGLLQSGEE
jgi:membrane protein